MTRKLFEYGGWIAGAVLIAFGVAAIVMGINGRNEVRDALAAQKITAGDDAAEITNGKLQPGQEITTGAEAKQFAKHHGVPHPGGDGGRAVRRDGPLPDRRRVRTRATRRRRRRRQTAAPWRTASATCG